MIHLKNLRSSAFISVQNFLFNKLKPAQYFQAHQQFFQAHAIDTHP